MYGLFIKQYAEAVDLDSDEMLSMYKNTTPEVSSEVKAGQRGFVDIDT